MILKTILLPIILFSSIINLAVDQNKDFKKVVIWGHKLHSHTHSFIHYGFFKAFTHLGYDTYWFDNNDNVSNFDFDNCLIITEGQVDQKLPLNNKAFYILHNCSHEKYKELFAQGRCIFMQVFTNDCFKYKLEKLEDFIYANKDERVICMPWATDLLPAEIELNKLNLTTINKKDFVFFIGTIGDGVHGNKEQIEPFIKACNENNIEFITLTNFKTTMQENKTYVQESYMSPALQGKWQCDNGYIPCRIFKNVSYGQFPITNCKTIDELFKGKAIYNQDTYQLFYDAQNKLKNLNQQELIEMMDFVKNNHTYINRINTLLKFIKDSQPK